MNYSKIYYDIIDRARSESRSKKQGYFESHHIQPRSIKGSNTKENLVLLTAKEHYLAHMLLVEMYPRGSYEWRKMIYAASMFLAINSKHERYRPSARFYSQIREELSKIKTGVPRTEETKEKIRKTKAKNPRIYTEEERKLFSERVQGDKNPMYGKTHTQEVKNYLSFLKRGVKNPKVSETNKQRVGKKLSYTKEILQYDLQGHLISTYVSIAEAKRQTGILSINGALAGRWSTAGGYYWKYKTQQEVI